MLPTMARKTRAGPSLPSATGTVARQLNLFSALQTEALLRVSVLSNFRKQPSQLAGQKRPAQRQATQRSLNLNESLARGAASSLRPLFNYRCNRQTTHQHRFHQQALMRHPASDFFISQLRRSQCSFLLLIESGIQIYQLQPTYILITPNSCWRRLANCLLGR
jgi:hypothetical protein